MKIKTLICLAIFGLMNNPLIASDDSLADRVGVLESNYRHLKSRVNTLETQTFPAYAEVFGGCNRTNHLVVKVISSLGKLDGNTYYGFDRVLSKRLDVPQCPKQAEAISNIGAFTKMHKIALCVKHIDIDEGAYHLFSIIAITRGPTISENLTSDPMNDGDACVKRAIEYNSKP